MRQRGRFQREIVEFLQENGVKHSVFSLNGDEHEIVVALKIGLKFFVKSPIGVAFGKKLLKIERELEPRQPKKAQQNAQPDGRQNDFPDQHGTQVYLPERQKSGGKGFEKGGLCAKKYPKALLRGKKKSHREWFPGGPCFIQQLD